MPVSFPGALRSFHFRHWMANDFQFFGTGIPYIPHPCYKSLLPTCDRSQMSLLYTSSTHVLDDRPRFPYRIVAKRLVPHTGIRSEDGRTVLVTHGVGYCKELWEPCLNYLLALERTSKAIGIREIWTFDAINAGEAVMLNEEALRLRESITSAG